MSAKRIALGGLMLALALTASWVETRLPSPLPSVPGIKLGLANCIVMIVMYTMGSRFALALNVGRVVLAGFMFTGLGAIMFSLTGAVVSFSVMYGLKRTAKFSVVGIGCAGGAAHNFGQLLAAVPTLGDPGVLLYYYPVLIVSGLICGFVTGVGASLTLNRVKGL